MEEKKKKTVRQKAVALKYVPREDQAPKVTAKGSGLVAEKIIQLAKEHGVPIKEDLALIEVLSRLDIHQDVPPSVYVVVAEILSFVYAINNRWPHLKGRKG